VCIQVVPFCQVIERLKERVDTQESREKKYCQRDSTCRRNHSQDPTMNVNFEVFNSLLQAPSKVFVDDLLQHVALDTLSPEFTSESAKSLNVSDPQMKSVRCI
jgi:hypothetical protein